MELFNFKVFSVIMNLCNTIILVAEFGGDCWFAAFLLQYMEIFTEYPKIVGVSYIAEIVILQKIWDFIIQNTSI